MFTRIIVDFDKTNSIAKLCELSNCLSLQMWCLYSGCEHIDVERHCLSIIYGGRRRWKAIDSSSVSVVRCALCVLSIKKQPNRNKTITKQQRSKSRGCGERRCVPNTNDTADRWNRQSENMGSIYSRLGSPSQTCSQITRGRKRKHDEIDSSDETSTVIQKSLNTPVK